MSLPDGGDASARYLFLKSFQNQRLRHDYEDFSRQKKWRATADFFFGQVYNTEDVTERDAAFEALHLQISKILGGDIIKCMHQMIALQQLTIQLDLVILEELTKAGAGPSFSNSQYENAYMTSDNYEARIEQIELSVSCLQLAGKIFRKFGVGPGLRALHRFMKSQGEGLATGFLLDGYKAISPIRDLSPLLNALDSRERERLDRIYQR